MNPDGCGCGFDHGCCITADPATGRAYSMSGERLPAHDDPKAIEAAAQREPEAGSGP